ncbi:2-hydroxy-6-oxononadienedioate/2-hydroxy-6-oxononatrienedioate hydrolase [Serratia liquefaciens]|nr:2-hydroxy-6-oxononadienedioate/2-hydroxy-6-oxononatrienedioate hydrolase [Serratia liquefaciens]
MSYQPQTEAATSRFLNVDEGGRTLRIHINDCGDGKETVVMLHGSGPGATGWANFSRNIDPLVEAGYRVLLLDCPGWGKSDAIVNSGSRSDLNARILKSVVDQLGIDKVHLLGNSMGGHSAVAFTLSWPERVAKLVLMGGGTGGMSLFTPMPTEGIKLLNALYREPTIEKPQKDDEHLRLRHPRPHRGAVRGASQQYAVAPRPSGQLRQEPGSQPEAVS